MTTSTGGECDDSSPGGNDSYQNQNSTTPGSQQQSISGPIFPGGPNGPDGTIIEEIMTAVVGKKQPVRGQAYRAQNGEYVSYYCTDDGVLYRPGDSVYIESQKADQPYFICSIREFRRGKRDNLMVNIKWFYRPSEVPETVYQLLIQDRNSENILLHKCLAIDEPQVKSRELFISDATDTYPVSVLRGICKVEHYADIHAVREFQTELNSFFYILGYNPETRRLASAQGEIRIGPSHQAKLPEFRGHINIDDRPEQCDDWEEIRWRPGIAPDETLKMYLHAARSMAAFAGLCDNGSITDGNYAASKDSTTIGALDIFHESNYDKEQALGVLTKVPVPENLSKKWSEEDIKRFIKGLRMYGKNFFRIRKEFLNHKETMELVSFYYLWKKTPAAAGHRPHRRHRRQNILRRIRTPRGATRNSGPADPMDPSSASEKEDDSDDGDSKDRQGYHCRHCYTTASRDWHHAGKGKQLLCYDCRMHFKHYGDLPLITNPREPPPPSAILRSQQQPVVEEVGMRTRTRAKEISTRQRVSLRSRGNTPDINDDSDSHTMDRAPDLKTGDNNSTLAEKKVEGKVRKLTIVQLPQEENFLELANKMKGSGNNESLGASSDESMTDESLISCEGSKSVTYSLAKAPYNPDPEFVSGAQSCSVILKASTILSDHPNSLPQSPDNTTKSRTASPQFIGGEIPAKITKSSENELRSNQSDDASISEVHSESSLGLVSKSRGVPHSMSSSSDPNNGDSQHVLSPMHANAVGLPTSTRINLATGDVGKQNETVCKTLSSDASDVTAISRSVPLLSTHCHTPIDSVVNQLKSTEMSKMHTHSNFPLTPSVIHSSHISERLSSLQHASARSGATHLAQLTSNTVSNTLAATSIVSQSSRMSVLPPSELRNSSNSPSFAPPPAHTLPAPPTRHFHTPSPPPVAHPNSPQLFRPHHSVLLPHSVLELAKSPLSITSVASSQEEIKSNSIQSPKASLSQSSDNSCNFSDNSSIVAKNLLRHENNFYPGVYNFSQHNLPPHAMLPTPSTSHLPQRPDQLCVSEAAQSLNHPNSIQQEGRMFNPAIGMQLPFEKTSVVDSPLSLSVPGLQSDLYQRIPSPLISGMGNRVILNPTQTDSVKSEFIKKEFHLNKDTSGNFHQKECRPEMPKKEERDFKPEVYAPKQERFDRPEAYAPKQERFDRPETYSSKQERFGGPETCAPRQERIDRAATYSPKQERFDRPETYAPKHERFDRPEAYAPKQERFDRPAIIAEIKTESKSGFTTNSAAAAHIPPVVPQLPGNYIYPHLPHQDQFMSAKYSTSGSPKSSSPPLHGRGPAPPAHIGLPIFSGRHRVPIAQPSFKSPGSSMAVPRESPELALPTPPAAHTGPVKPPVASHPLHSPLSCIIPSPQSLGSHSLHQHSLSHSASPNCSSSQLPTTQALPPTVPPSHSGFTAAVCYSVHDGEDHDDDDEAMPHREPSPVPKMEDSECHRSQSAIFLRHWNRGEYNSCARTDLTFKPVPDSQLCRKREERARRQAERERVEEKERTQKKAATPDKRETPKLAPSMAEPPNYSSTCSIYDRMLPRTSDIPTSGVSRLGVLPTSSLRPPSIGLPPTLIGAAASSHIDPLLQHYNALYPIGSRERMELEREREFDRFKEDYLKQRPHLDAPPPYGVGLSPHLLAGPRFGPSLQSTAHSSAFPPPGMYAHPAVSNTTIMAAERDRYERMAAASLVSYHASRPLLLRPSESHQRLPHGYPSAHAALLGRPYDEQLAHMAAQEQMQRQLLLERERLSQFNSQGPFRP